MPFTLLYCLTLILNFGALNLCAAEESEEQPTVAERRQNLKDNLFALRLEQSVWTYNSSSPSDKRLATLREEDSKLYDIVLSGLIQSTLWNGEPRDFKYLKNLQSITPEIFTKQQELYERQSKEMGSSKREKRITLQRDPALARRNLSHTIRRAENVLERFENRMMSQRRY